MFFKLIHRSSKSNARAGKIFTDRGVIRTPIFMPVGTLGTVKGVHQKELSDNIKAQIILSNTYHLFLRPGRLQTCIICCSSIINSINYDTSENR